MAAASTACGTDVWATGFRSPYDWLTIPGAVVDGRPQHRRGSSPVDELHFLGLPWQHTRGSALLGFVQHDAAYRARAARYPVPLHRLAADARLAPRICLQPPPLTVRGPP